MQARSSFLQEPQAATSDFEFLKHFSSNSNLIKPTLRTMRCSYFWETFPVVSFTVEVKLSWTKPRTLAARVLSFFQRAAPWSMSVGLPEESALSSLGLLSSAKRHHRPPETPLLFRAHRTKRSYQKTWKGWAVWVRRTRKALSRNREMLSNYSTCSIHYDKRKVQFCVSGSAAGFPTDEKSNAGD